MTRAMSSSIIASCLLLAACGGGSGAANDDGPAADPLPDPTMEDDTSPAAGGAPTTAGGEGGAADEPEDDPVEDPEDDLPPDTVPDPMDEEAPTIVFTYPLAAAKGVLTDEYVVIDFSEAMDREATEAAYTSVELPSDAVTFTWSHGDTKLKITPNAPLEYAIGFDPETLVAKSYSLTLGTGATDLAGNALADDFELSFETARMLLAEAPLVGAYSGSINMETGEYEAAMRSGDLGSQDMKRTYATFALPEIPADRLETLVLLESAQIGMSGAPFTDLASGGQALLVAPASFSTPDEVHEMSMPAAVGNLSKTPEFGPRSLDVTWTVDNLYADGASLAQFIIQFPTATDGDDDDDLVLFDHNSTRLAIGYLLP